jgi:hypothetical protein
LEETHEIETEVAVKTRERKKKIIAFIDHWIFVAWMTALTIYALFFDDIRLIAFEKKDDDIFFSISTIALFFFTFEIVLASYANN